MDAKVVVAGNSNKRDRKVSIGNSFIDFCISKVYKAFDLINSRYVAIKIICKKKRKEDSDDGLDSLKKEVALLRSISSVSCLPTLYEIHETHESIFFVMEFIKIEQMQQNKSIF